MAYLRPSCSASRTIPYVPAPRVLPNLYEFLGSKSQQLSTGMRLYLVDDKLLVIANRLAGDLVEHIRDYQIPTLAIVVRYPVSKF